MKKPFRVLIVDDHSLMRVGLVTSLSLDPEISVVAEASTGRQALELYARHKPDVVLMDFRLPDMNGDEVISALCAQFPDAKVMAVSTYDSQEYIYRCVQAGARAYLSKNVVLEELLRAIRLVCSGQNYLPPVIASRLVERLHAPQLSPRESAVLQLMAKGSTNKEIAQALSIAETTVKDHVSNILIKLKATDRTQASTIAIQRGLVHLDS